MTAILSPQDTWYLTNHQHLTTVLNQIKQRLQLTTEPEPQIDTHLPSLVLRTATGKTTLDWLHRLFELSDFELATLILCAGMELEGEWATLCAAAQGDPNRGYPTLSLALSILPGAAWSAVAPSAPLRQWQLIEIGGGNALTTSPIRINERVLHYLIGLQQLDPRLLDLLEPVQSICQLVESHQQLAQRIVDALRFSISQRSLSAHHSRFPVLQLLGEDDLSKRAIAGQACSEIGLTLYELSAETLPTDLGQLALVRTLCEREFILSNLAILFDCNYLEQSDHQRRTAIAKFIETTNVPIILSTRDRLPQRQRATLILEVHAPSIAEQKIVWQASLTPQAIPYIDSLIAQFNLSPSAIQTACLQANSQWSETTASHQLLWNICRVQARPRLDELAQRIEAHSTWDDLILPDKEKTILQEITAHVQQRSRVYEEWGFGHKSRRGLGISALFAGASGTGKTTAAEVIARELHLDVYRIDLSAIVSKYIGETEKNLRRVFDAAEGGGVILLFDEADSLFGKRGDVKDSHDRYANMEVSYLLQRMESYRGLAILTTNLKGAMDQAFLRRIRFVIQFPFPDATQREEIWRRVFPSSTPVADIAYQKLAKLNIAGGNIRNIALNAAFIAAAENVAVNMNHLLQAARNEYLKLERPLTDSEVKGWI